MNAEPGTVKKWKVADISRVVADGVVVEIGRLANEFVRADGEPVQLVLELEDLSARKPNARQNVSMVKVSPWQRPSSLLGSCASSGRLWQLWAARYS